MIFLIGIVIILAILAFLLVTGGPKSGGIFYSGSCRRKSLSSETLQKVNQALTQISELESLGNPAHLKQAVIDSDKVLSLILTEQYGERGFVEKMKQAKIRFSDSRSYENLWQAHKIRNLIAHEIGTEIPSNQLREALGNYRAGISRLIS